MHNLLCVRSFSRSKVIHINGARGEGEPGNEARFILPRLGFFVKKNLTVGVRIIFKSTQSIFNGFMMQNSFSVHYPEVVYVARLPRIQELLVR